MAAALSLEPRYSVREQRGWYFYDWANSAFSTTVVTLFLGPYLTAVAKAAANGSQRVYPLGIPVDSRSYWGYLISLSVITQVVCLPILGALADYSHRKKELLALFGFLGAGATAAMFFVEGTSYLLGGALFLIANLAFGCSVVIYNSFLPEIAPESEQDSVSSKGWGLGYIGGGLCLALNLFLYAKAEAIGISEGLAVRINLASAGLWWGLFMIIPLLTLRKRPAARVRTDGPGLLAVGFGQIIQTVKDMRRYPQTLTFLLAYLLYNDAIQTVITLASQFGNDELKIPLSTLTQIVLMVQFVAFAGAMLFNQIAAWLGTKNAVVLSLILWTSVVVAMYGFVHTNLHFWIASAVVAIILGGSQALSRSLYSRMIPKGKEAEYFSLYEISDKGTSWLCPLMFGLALQFTGSYRTAILSLILFFILGLLILLKVDVRRAVAEAGN